MVPHAERIIENARKGEKIPTKDRRHAIAFIMATWGGTTNREIAEMFGISERAVRLDKKYVREEKAALIKDDDIGLVIADIVMSYDNQLRDIEKSKAKAKPGHRDYLAHCVAAFNMQRQKVEALQALGYYPKNLGNMTVENFSYKAIVHSDGSVDTRRTDMFDAGSTEVRDLDAIEAEFTDVTQKALPAPETIDT